MLERSERGSCAELAGEVAKGLHDLCQPLTALQCRLYLGITEMEPAALVEALEESLAECERVMHRVRQLQDRMEEFRVQTDALSAGETI